MHLVELGARKLLVRLALDGMEFHHDFSGLVNFALHQQPARAFGNQADDDKHHDWPNQSQSEWASPLSVLGEVVPC